MGVDVESFSEDLVVKARKPYTITKQREKWTEEEHNRFLEALKLYGRAWQRIEDHIGTKSAIQIRSHAQKFFTKLEKEAVATFGSPLGRAHDIIDIPPPRPKKKPNYPYPRKSGLYSTPPATVAGEESLKPMNPLPQQITNKQEVSAAAESFQQTKECSAILNLIPSRDKSSKNRSFGFREYVPVPPPSSSSSLTASSLTMEARSGVESTFKGLTNSDENIVRTSGVNMGRHSLSANSDKSNHKTSAVEDGDSPFSTSPLLNHLTPAAAMSFPQLPQLLTTPDLQTEFSSFSTELVSTLQQNPSVYAAACMAASSEMCSPSKPAIVAATIAAASAWWSSNGFILFPPPIHAPGFQFSPVVNYSVQTNEETMEEASGCADQQAVQVSSSSDGAHYNLQGKKNGKLDPSSCGSNTTSSSEIETDAAALKKDSETNKDNVEGELSQNIPTGEANIRRVRTNLFLNDSWKEVSHQGRLAFQELFSRASLPQSFALATQLDKLEMRFAGEEMLAAARDHQITSSQNSCQPNEIKHGNLKMRRTGFKPYKRCSAELVEVRKSSSTANDGTSNKKIRLEGEVQSLHS